MVRKFAVRRVNGLRRESRAKEGRDARGLEDDEGLRVDRKRSVDASRYRGVLNMRRHVLRSARDARCQILRRGPVRRSSYLTTEAFVPAPWYQPGINLTLRLVPLESRACWRAVYIKQVHTFDTAMRTREMDQLGRTLRVNSCFIYEAFTHLVGAGAQFRINERAQSTPSDVAISR